MKIAVAFALGLALAGPVAAKNKDWIAVEAAAVKDKPTVTLDPAKAYILYKTSGPITLSLIKIPSAEEVADYGRSRAEKMAKARATYAKRLASYDAARRQNAAARKGNDRAVALPTKPVEPTEANLAFTPLLVHGMVPIGPNFRFAKVKGGESTYLHELTPGDYRVYGPVALAPQPGSMCFCMGSVAFSAKAGGDYGSWPCWDACGRLHGGER